MKLNSQYVLEIDVPNKCNRIYGLEAVEKLIADFNRMAYPTGKASMPVYGCLSSDLKFEPKKLLTIKVEDYSHQICQLYNKDGILRADIAILDTPKGLILKELYLKKQMDFRIACFCTMVNIDGKLNVTLPIFFSLFATDEGA